MNIKYFIQARAVQTASFYLDSNMLELCLEAMQRDIQQIGDNKEAMAWYRLQVQRSFAAYEKRIPNKINQLLK